MQQTLACSKADSKKCNARWIVANSKYAEYGNYGKGIMRM